MQYAMRSRQRAAATNVLPMPVRARSTAARCGTRHSTRTGACPSTAPVKQRSSSPALSLAFLPTA
eukprot:9167080-Pyramimonas_sp.AAC.1